PLFGPPSAGGASRADKVSIGCSSARASPFSNASASASVATDTLGAFPTRISSRSPPTRPRTATGTAHSPTIRMRRSTSDGATAGPPPNQPPAPPAPGGQAAPPPHPPRSGDAGLRERAREPALGSIGGRPAAARLDRREARRLHCALPVEIEGSRHAGEPPVY